MSSEDVRKVQGELQQKLVVFLFKMTSTGSNDQAAVDESLCKNLDQALKDCRSQRRSCLLTAHAFGFILRQQQPLSQQLMSTVAAFFSNMAPTDWKPELCQMVSSAVQAMLESEPAAWQTPVLQQLFQPMKLSGFVMRPDTCSNLINVLSAGAVRASGGAVVHEVTSYACHVLLRPDILHFVCVAACVVSQCTQAWQVCNEVASCLTAMQCVSASKHVRSKLMLCRC